MIFLSSGVASTTISSDGTAVSSSELRVTLTRYDLAASFECQSTNLALQNPLRSRVDILLHGERQSMAGQDISAPV